MLSSNNGSSWVNVFIVVHFWEFNVIEFITIASTGNGTDFGDLTRSNYLVSATTNSTRAVFGGGLTPNVNTMDFVTIATTGNATDYGDLITASSGRANGSNADSHGGLQG